MIKPKWKRRTGLMAAALFSALSLPGLAVQATETIGTAMDDVVSVGIGYLADTGEEGFPVSLSVLNDTADTAEVRITDIQEEDGTKLVQEETFLVESGENRDLYFTVEGTPRMLSANVSVTAGDVTQSAQMQFSDTVRSSNTYDMKDVSQNIEKNVDTSDRSEGKTSITAQTDADAVPGMGTTVVEVPRQMHIGVIIGIVCAVAAVSIVVVWQVMKKRKGRNEES